VIECVWSIHAAFFGFVFFLGVSMFAHDEIEVTISPARSRPRNGSGHKCCSGIDRPIKAVAALEEQSANREEHRIHSHEEWHQMQSLKRNAHVLTDLRGTHAKGASFEL